MPGVPNVGLFGRQTADIWNSFAPIGFSRGSAFAKGVGESAAVVSRQPLRWIDNVFNMARRDRVTIPKNVEAPFIKSPQREANTLIEKELGKGVPSVPAKGINPNAVQTGSRWWVGPTKVAAYGTAGVGVGVGVASLAPKLGQAVGEGIKGVGQGTGQGLGDAFYGLFSGLGAGAGSGLRAAGEGVAGAVKPLLLPALLVVGGVLLFGALKK